MASSSASGRELTELKQELKGLKEQKAAVLAGLRDQILLDELNKDLDRVQAAITALSCGEVDFPAEQEIWVPACFAIPWLLGQQVRHKKQQIRQSKEIGHQSKKVS